MKSNFRHVNYFIAKEKPKQNGDGPSCRCRHCNRALTRSEVGKEHAGNAMSGWRRSSVSFLSVGSLGPEDRRMQDEWWRSIGALALKWFRDATSLREMSDGACAPDDPGH
jgi:hypothetical protein